MGEKTMDRMVVELAVNTARKEGIQEGLEQAARYLDEVKRQHAELQVKLRAAGSHAMAECQQIRFEEVSGCITAIRALKE